MKLSVLLHTTDYRGDHAADVIIAHEIQPGETVQQLAERLLGNESYIKDGAKVIEIRIVQEAQYVRGEL